MSDEQPKSYADVLIERQSIRLGQMATQIESLIMQVEQANWHLAQAGLNPDGTPIINPNHNGEQQRLEGVDV
jgi:hypothetical protein